MSAIDKFLNEMVEIGSSTNTQSALAELIGWHAALIDRVEDLEKQLEEVKGGEQKEEEHAA